MNESEKIVLGGNPVISNVHDAKDYISIKVKKNIFANVT